MKKPVVASSLDTSKGPSHLAAIESKLFHGLLNVVKHLVINRYDNGEARVPGTFIWRVEGSHFKLIAKDPTTRLQLSVVANTVDDAWALMDLYLGSEDAPWEDDPNAWVPSAKVRKRP